MPKIGIYDGVMYFGLLFSLVLVIIGYLIGYQNSFNFHLNVRHAALYRTLPVFELHQNDVANYGDNYNPRKYFDAIKSTASDVELIHHQNRLIYVKQNMGCYGTTDVLVPDSTNATEVATLLDAKEAGMRPASARDDWTRPASSVCTCIDDHVKSIHKNSYSANYPVQKNDFDICNGATTTNIDCVNALRGYHKMIVSDCTLNAVPVSTQSFEGVFDVQTGVGCGLLLLLNYIWCCMMVVRRRKNAIDDSQETVVTGLPEQKVAGGAMYYVNAVVTLGLGIALFVDAIVMGENTEHKDILSFRPETDGAYTYTFKNEFGISISCYVMVAGIVQLLLSSTGVVKILLKNSESDLVISVQNTVFCDIVKIVGFSVLGVSLMIRSGVSNVEHLYYALIVFSVTGFMQHLSNILRILYFDIGGNLSKDILMKLQTSGPSKNESQSEVDKQSELQVSSVKKFLQFIVYSRLYIFAVIIFVIANFVFGSMAEVSPNRLQTWNSGHFMYFVLFFILANVSYDIVYEIIPGTFISKYSNLNFCCSVSLFYCFYFSVSELVFITIQNGPNARWSK